MGDYETLAGAVEADGSDFGAWSKLLACVEEGSVGHPERVGPTFEAFLAKFPLCFGYWCKYAELQQKLTEAGALDAADAEKSSTSIYDRALDAVPLSVELWKAYCAHVKALTAGQTSDQLRAAYLRATDAVGHDSAAAGLWDAFMEFEADRGTPESVCDVFKKMLTRDTSGRTDELWKRLKMLCKSYRTSELVEEETRTQLLERYKEAKKMNTAEDELEQLGAGRVAGMSELHEQRQMEQMMTECERSKNDLIQRRLERTHYEAGVRRWYFHVKPLDDAQLRNWRDYLTLEADKPMPCEEDAREKQVAHVKALFERCLVPCALYAEFWLRYVSWARVNLASTEALAIATRAATVFLPRRPDVLGVLATLLEAADRTEDARSVYAAVAAAAETADQKAFGAILVANFERRMREPDKVDAAYGAAIADGAPEVVAAHVARYQCQLKRDLPAARATLDAALAATPQCAELWHAKAQVEASRLGSEKVQNVFANVATVYDAALADDSPVPDQDRGKLWAQYRAAANDLCGDAKHLLTITKRYAKWRTKADLHATPLGPVPKRKRKRDAAANGSSRHVAAAADAQPAAEPEQAASALLSSYGAYASYGAQA